MSRPSSRGSRLGLKDGADGIRRAEAIPQLRCRVLDHCDGVYIHCRLTGLCAPLHRFNDDIRGELAQPQQLFIGKRTQAEGSELVGHCPQRRPPARPGAAAADHCSSVVTAVAVIPVCVCRSSSVGTGRADNHVRIKSHRFQQCCCRLRQSTGATSASPVRVRGELERVIAGPDIRHQVAYPTL
jgi:hypothetical protein